MTDALFDRRMLEALVCPKTGGRLDYDPVQRELVSRAGHLAYPIRNGIPVMLVDEARVVDTGLPATPTGPTGEH